ncbi:unnamed protein product [Prorocentrum cordatum]|uniref:Procollagen-proline 3-dioxygenase n=1 Tax=Prorocentrum cordatum TaxID=2364126 RepID=A0ABN9SX61_9DINO|nr:unnamed protein product [Polarella glacialis]
MQFRRSAADPRNRRGPPNVSIDAILCSPNSHLGGVIEVPPGYTRLSAWWSQSEDSPEPQASRAVLFLAVLPPGGTHGDLEASAARAAAASAEEVGPLRRRHEELSAEFRNWSSRPLHAVTAIGSANSGLVDPAVLDAVADGSPRSLWSVLSATGTTLPGGEHSMATCGARRRAQSELFRLPLLAPLAGERILEELDVALRSPLARGLSLPNNNEGPHAQSVRERRVAGVVLDEIGLGGIASSLARDVLQPFARLLHPEWDADAFDSYHAFTISEYASAKPAHMKPWKTAANEDDLDWVKRAPKHNDICEISMNVCLGRNFTGGGVYFLDALGPSKPWEPQLVEHIAGMAFINRCQHHHGTFPISEGERHTLVIRLLSSEFRRAPAEGFASRCMGPPFTAR